VSRAGASTSLRLSMGFLLVLAVFGAALLTALYNLQKVKNASESIRIRQEIRREAGTIGQLAEELFRCQQQFVEAAGLDWRKLTEFQELYQRMEQSLDSLLSRPVEEPERGYLVALRNAATRLRTIFLDKTVVARMQIEMGLVPEVGLGELEQQSRNVLEEIGDLNERVAYAFEIRTLDAELYARSAWNLNVALSKVIFPVALLICLLVIYYTHRSIMKPVGALLEGTQELASGKLSSSISLSGTGEFTELAQSFNRMARALEANQKQLVEAEKMASVGRLAAGVAHEINNPIAVILGYSKMLAAGVPDDSSRKEQLLTVVEEAQQCKHIVDGLLDLSRPSDPTEGEVINPNDVVAEVLNTVQALQLGEGVTIEDSVIDRELPLTIGRARMRQLALNIVRNALEALRRRQDGRLTIEGYVRPRTKIEAEALEDASEGHSFLILVFADNGPGIPAEHLDRLFEPFYTTKTEGMGLGLAISYNIARAHGGFIRVESAVGEGTTFTVGLPLSEEA
jgi:signal transduction histidine kinase